MSIYIVKRRGTLIGVMHFLTVMEVLKKSVVEIEDEWKQRMNRKFQRKEKKKHSGGKLFSSCNFF